MVKALALLFLVFVVVWDFVSAGPENAAVTRAGAELVRWVRTEIERQRLLDGTGEAHGDAAQAAETPVIARTEWAPALDAARVQIIVDTTTAAPVEPAIVETTFAPAPPAGSSQLVIGDSVFEKKAILTFIAEASERTSVSAAYMEALALRESSFNPVAASDQSTARGLYQFIESTWLEVFARHGAQHGQGELADQVVVARGRPSVADNRIRNQILNLRYDPKLSTFLAARLASDNRDALEAGLGRPVSDAELYIAHFLGLAGARTLIETRAANPRADAAKLFPWAAASNRGYFYDGRRHKTAAEVYDALLLQAGDLREDAGLEARARQASGPG